MMHYVVKKTFTAPLEHIDVEYEQRNLFELSVGKLQQEQLRHGVEPRLLRFVLINNALRALQGHMMKVDEPPITFTDQNIQNENTESFICNTFKDGGLSLSPQSPPTPIKVRKLGSLLSDQSPLVASTPFLGLSDDSSLGEDGNSSASSEFGKLVESIGRNKDVKCEGGGDGEGGGGGGEKETESSPTYPVHGSCLGKHSIVEDNRIPEAKKVCSDDQDVVRRPNALQMKSVLTTLNGVHNGLHNGLDLDHIAPNQSPPRSSDPESDDESSTLSPIDFTKVDASLYDYDLSGGHDPPVSVLQTTSHLLSLVSTQPLTTMTTAHPSTTTSSHQASCSTDSSISKAAQTESILTHLSNSLPDVHSETNSKDKKTFSGTSCSMEGIVSTQNGDLDGDTNTLTRNVSNGKSSCSQEGNSEGDFFEDLVSLLIT